MKRFCAHMWWGGGGDVVRCGGGVGGGDVVGCGGGDVVGCGGGDVVGWWSVGGVLCYLARFFFQQRDYLMNMNQRTGAKKEKMTHYFIPTEVPLKIFSPIVQVII